MPSSGTTDFDSDRLIEADIGRVLKHLDSRYFAGKKLFMTGGTGFYGFWLLSAVQALNKRGVRTEVVVLSRDPGRFLKRHPGFVGSKWLRFVEGDVLSYEATDERFDSFIHAATDTNAQAHKNPMDIFDTIVGGSRRVLEHAVRSGARRILLASSAAVYGRFPPGITHISEDATTACDPLDSGSAYGEAKRAMETSAVIFMKEHGIEPVIARGFAFAGPGLALDGHFAIGNFVRDALSGRDIEVRGDGAPTRSYLYGADLAVWLLKLLGRGTPGRAYNLGSDSAVTIKELAYLVRDTLAANVRVNIAGEPEVGPRSFYVPDIGRAREELNLQPWTDLKTALELWARWIECEDEHAGKKTD